MTDIEQQFLQYGQPNLLVFNNGLLLVVLAQELVVFKNSLTIAEISLAYYLESLIQLKIQQIKLLNELSWLAKLGTNIHVYKEKSKTTVDDNKQYSHGSPTYSNRLPNSRNSAVIRKKFLSYCHKNCGSPVKFL